MSKVNFSLILKAPASYGVLGANDIAARDRKPSIAQTALDLKTCLHNKKIMEGFLCHGHEQTYIVTFVTRSHRRY